MADESPDVAAAVRAQTRFQRRVVIALAVIVGTPLAMAGYFRLLDSMKEDRDRKKVIAQREECLRRHPHNPDLYAGSSPHVWSAEHRAYVNCLMWGE